MGCVKLVFFMLYTFLCQLAFSSSSPHLCPEDQTLALLQFQNMFTINRNASDYCFSMITGREIQSYPRTLFWKKSSDCCSWDGVHCEKTTGQVIELDLRCSQLQGKFHSNGSLFQLFNLKRLDLSFNDFTGSLISPKFGNNGLRGLPPSRDCGGDDRVAQATIPVELYQEEDDSPMINWQAVLMGYGCGLVIGLSLSTQYPAWLSRMVVNLEHKISTRTKKHNKRYQCVATSRIQV